MSNTQLIGGFITGFLCIGMLSCDFNRQVKTPNTSVETKPATISPPQEAIKLDEEQFFDLKRIKEVQSTATETQKIRSSTYLQKALTLFAEREIDDCLQYLIKSISDYPTPEAYLGLGNSNVELGYYEDAIDAYHMAEWLNYEPRADIYYHMASAYFKDQTDLDGKNRAINYLKQALDNGYTDWEHYALNDKFGTYRYEEEYITLFLKHFQKDFSTEKEALFQLYIRLFPSQDFPVEVLLGELNTEEHKGIPYPISSRLSQFLKKNSRHYLHPADQYFYKALLEETDKYYAIVYQRVLAPTRKNNLRPGVTHFDVATYTKRGRLIDLLRFADNTNALVFKAGIVDKNQLIEIMHYKATWEQNFKKRGHVNNQIEHFDFVNSQTYLIGKNGKFIQKNSGKLLGENY